MAQKGLEYFFPKKTSDRESNESSQETANDGSSGPAKKKSRTLAEERRAFNKEWETLYFFTNEGTDEPVCLLFQKAVKSIKSNSFKRHYESLHAEALTKWPVGSQARARELIRLKDSLDVSRKTLKEAINQSELVCRASYELAFHVAKHQKPFSDGSYLKEGIAIFCSAVESQKMKAIADSCPLSRRTLTRRIQDISENLEAQLIEDIDSSLYYSLAVDESTDCRDTAQLLTWIRLVSADLKVKEEMLSITGLKGRTRAQDIFDALNAEFTRMRMDPVKLFSICTDGDPTMLGSKGGLVGLLSKKLERPLLSFHCIIHQQALCSKLKKEDVLCETMDQVVEIIKMIRGNALNHREFRAILEETESQYKDMVYHSEVRWLSRGKVLERFVECYDEIKSFLQKKKFHFHHGLLSNDAWKCDLLFLCDVTTMLADLNRKLQGPQKCIADLVALVNAFQNKLDLIIAQFERNDLTHFCHLKRVQDSGEELEYFRYLPVLQQLRERFNERFTDFESVNHQIKFLTDPYHYPVRNCCELSKEFNVDRRLLEDELLELQSNPVSCFSLPDWTILTEDGKLPLIKSIIARLLSCFGSTYTCESTFSHMNSIKSSYRSCLTEISLSSCLRCAVSNYKPQFNVLASTLNAQVSH